jgi:hypothetical protein
MSMPGFSAEHSLYRTQRSYRTIGTWTDPDAPGGVLPQLVLTCPRKGCGRCVRDSSSPRGGFKCCCHPPFDPETGECEPREVACDPDATPPPPPPPPCFTTSPPTHLCCGESCCAPGQPCCRTAGRCCPQGAHCCSDGDGCCPNGSTCRSIFGWRFCDPIF